MTELPPIRPWRRVSPSQINNYRRCALRWHWQSIRGIRTPQKASAALGEAVHKQVEKYLLDGTPPDETKAGRIAAAGLHLLPAGGSLTEDQVEWGFQSSLRHTDPALSMEQVLTGRVDFSEPGRITDIKTTSDFRYAKAAEELHTDPQAIAYLNAAWGKVPSGDDPDRMTFRLFYLRTKAPYQPKLVEASFTPELMRAGVASLRSTMLEMRDVATVETPAQVPHNTDACGDYGGCPHRAACALHGIKAFGAASALFTPTQGETTVSNPMGDFFSSLPGAAKKPEATPEPAPAAEAKPEATEPPPGINPPDGTPMDQVTTLADNDTGKEANENPIVQDDGTRLKSLKKDDTIALHTDLVAEVAGMGLGGEYKRRSELPAKGRKRMDYQQDVLLLLELKAGGASEQPAPAPEAEPCPVDRHIERASQATAPAPSPKADFLAVENAQAGFEKAETDKPIPYTPTDDEGDADLQNDAIAVLYLDCVPRGQRDNVTFIEDWEDLDDLRLQLEEAEGVSYWASLDFRKGERRLANGLERLVATGGVTWPQHLVCLSSTGLGSCRELRDVLIRHSITVIEGVAR